MLMNECMELSLAETGENRVKDVLQLNSEKDVNNEGCCIYSVYFPHLLHLTSY